MSAHDGLQLAVKLNALLTVGRVVYNIEVVLTKDGAEKVSKATGKNLGKLIVLLMDGKVIFSVRIKDRLDGRKVFMMNFTKEDAERFAGGINRQ